MATNETPKLHRLIDLSPETQRLMEALGIKFIEVGPLIGPPESHTKAEILRQLKEATSKEGNE